jgi:hypothetical protein
MAAVDFFNHINVLYSTLVEFCTPHTCPVMAAGPKYSITNETNTVTLQI